MPEVDAKYKKLLVVEGYLNIGGQTTFVLNRTADLKDGQPRIPEVAARMEVCDSQGTVAEGVSADNGECLLVTTALDINKGYKIKITTKNGKVYQTGFLKSKLTPQIDSISRKVENNGFKLYVNTHDDSNNTRYYSWDFHETWEIVSPIFARQEYKNGQVVDRDTSINISRCWQNNISSEILLGSTERLFEDRILLVPIAFVQGNSIKLGQLYSVLVRQYAHTREGYQYLENMKRNTEKIGSIFDPQPSEVKGNLTCVTDPEEQVIGWVGAGTVTEKRIFIHWRERLRGWYYQMKDCDNRVVERDSIAIYINQGYLVDQETFPQNNYHMAKAKCIDCRLMGSNVKPSYWPN